MAAKADPAKSERKARIDAILAGLPGVVAKKIAGLDAWFVNDRMFACINGEGLGLRLPAAAARDLQFSRENVVAFTPVGSSTSKEWIQINREDAAEYEKDREVIQASLDFVKGQAR